MRLLGLITARGGSKGIARKNIALCAGLPLLAWTVRAAKQSGVISRLILSTDDQEIAELGRSYGLEVPFMRPADLANDRASSIDVVLHALRWLQESEDYIPDYVLLLQPTSPLRRAKDIRGAWEKVCAQGAVSVIGISPAREHPFWVKRMDTHGRITEFLAGESVPATRQELPPAYVVNGAIYLSATTAILANNTFYSDPTYGYVMPPECSVDVDTELDLRLAELLLKRNHDGD